MSFGHSRRFTNKFTIGIKQQLCIAEDSNLDNILVENPDDGFNSFSDKQLIGIIFHWKSDKDEKYDKSRYTNEEIEILNRPLKNIYTVKGLTEVEKFKMDDGATYTTEKPKLIIEKIGDINFDYLPKKQTTITDIDMWKYVDEIGFGMIKSGKYIINSYGSYGMIKDIFVEENVDKDLSNFSNINPHMVNIMKDVICVSYHYENTHNRIDVNNIKFVNETKEIFDEDFVRKWFIIPDDELKLFDNKMKQIEESGNIDEFDDILSIGDGSDIGNTTKELVGFDSKNHLISVHSDIAIKKNKANVINACMTRSLAVKKEEVDRIMEKKKNELSKIMDKMLTTIKAFEKEMKKIYRLITTLEIYMGVTEKVIQISEGENAPVETPISLRQLQLYMDEEFGDTDGGGLDFRSIDKFDEWLIDSKNYEVVAPEKKCVVIMRPRRNMKHYSDNPYINEKMQHADKIVYVIIRNGDNIYRIWTDKIEIQNRLFPKKNELQEIMDSIFKMNVKKTMISTSREFDVLNDEYDKVDDKIFNYKRNMLLLQGIIMRTPIFHPLPEGLNLLDVETHGDNIEFIYDEENILQDDKPRFWDYVRNINSKIDKGSRIFLVDKNFEGGSVSYSDRFSIYWSNDYSAPPMPKSGVYEVNKNVKVYEEDIIREITLEEYDEASKIWDDIVIHYDKIKNDNTKSVNYKIPIELHNKYHKYGMINRFIKDGVAMARVRVKDPNGANKDSNYYRVNHPYLQKKTEIETFRISYNPEDVVYSKWGLKSHKRKANLTFIIKRDDTFIINYDALILEDIEYYLNSRIDRPNYLKMIPILRGLRDDLMQEKQQEIHFCKSLTYEIKKDVGSISTEDIEKYVIECIEWWKEEVVTVWRRPISKDDKKAMEMITKRVKSGIKKKFKLKDLDTGIDNTKKILAWKHPDMKDVFFIGYGFTKNDFINGIVLLEKSRFDNNMRKKYTKAAVGRDMFEIKENDPRKLYDKIMKLKSGIVHMYDMT